VENVGLFSEIVGRMPTDGLDVAVCCGVGISGVWGREFGLDDDGDAAVCNNKWVLVMHE
jgi:hypothetical protein